MTETVYFIQSHDGPIKIGKTTNVRRRVDFLKTASAAKLTLLGVMANEDGLERRLHDKFSDLRLEGEWFSPSARLVDWISENAKRHDPIKRSSRNYGCRFTQLARRYVETLERRFAEENGWPKPHSHKHIAESLNIPRGTITRLIAFTLVMINAETFEKIEQFYVKHTIDTLRLCKERLAILRGDGDPSEVAAALLKLDESEATFSRHLRESA